MQSSLATFSCHISLERDGLRVAYAMQNTVDSDVGIFNRIELTGKDGTPTVRPENAYIDLEGSTLRIQKMVLPIPEGLAMTARPVPYVTRLPPGQVFREEFVLSLPIRTYNPMKRAELAAASPRATIVADDPKSANSVAFYVGVFQSRPGTKFIPVLEEFPDVYRFWPPGPGVDAQIVLSESMSLAVPIPVLDYRAVPRE